jgi:hypothetical protein
MHNDPFPGRLDRPNMNAHEGGTTCMPVPHTHLVAIGPPVYSVFDQKKYNAQQNIKVYTKSTQSENARKQTNSMCLVWYNIFFF